MVGTTAFAFALMALMAPQSATDQQARPVIADSDSAARPSHSVDQTAPIPDDRLLTAPPVGCKPAATPDDGVIVVCGRRSNEQYRLRPLPANYEHPNAFGRRFHARLGALEINGLSATLHF